MKKKGVTILHVATSTGSSYTSANDTTGTSNISTTSHNDTTTTSTCTNTDVTMPTCIVDAATDATTATVSTSSDIDTTHTSYLDATTTLPIDVSNTSVDELLNSILSSPSPPSPDGYTNLENVDITSSPTNERQLWLQTKKGTCTYMQDYMYILNESFTLLYRSDRCKKQNF